MAPRSLEYIVGSHFPSETRFDGRNPLYLYLDYRPQDLVEFVTRLEQRYRRKASCHNAMTSISPYEVPE
jgi:hypothetical protein